MHLQSIISIHLTGELATTQWLHEFLQQQQHQQWQQTSYFTFDSFFRHSFQSTCAGRVRDFCEKFLPQIHIENRFCWFRTTFVFVRIVQSLCIQFQLSTVFVCVCVFFLLCRRSLHVVVSSSKTMDLFYFPDFSSLSTGWKKSAKRFIIYLKGERIIFWCIYVPHTYLRQTVCPCACSSGSGRVIVIWANVWRSTK